MRISGNINTENIIVKTKTFSSDNVTPQGSEVTLKSKVDLEKIEVLEVDNSEETKTKVQEAVNKMNEMLDVNNSSSKFMYHEGLERYYVSIVNRETDEVVKEIPPKRLLDAFYEMQKMLGMIVDEKI